MGVLSARHGEVLGSELNGLRLNFEAQVFETSTDSN